MGSKQGAPVIFDWAMPSLLPQFLPWLAILALLMLKPNRCASAWWIWIPLAAVAAVASAPESALQFLPSAQFGVFLDLIGALGFGLAAVWLLSSYAGWKHRMLAFLGILLAQGVFGVLAFVLRQGWQGVGSETFVVGVCLAVSVLVVSVALSLAGLLCRRRYGWLRLTLWLIAALVAVWLLVIGPLFIIQLMASGGNVPMTALAGLVLAATGITFGVLLPFLLLSFVNGFYRDRLKGLLHLGSTGSPPVITAPPLVVAEAAGG
jgi:hypothetical protein